MMMISDAASSSLSVLGGRKQLSLRKADDARFRNRFRTPPRLFAFFAGEVSLAHDSSD